MSLHSHHEVRLHHEPEVRDSAPRKGGRWRAIRDGVGTVIGVVLGIAPHVLHHIGLLAGAALITGASGNALFYAIGLVLSGPMLVRLYRRFRTPWAPTIAVAVFTGLFSVSAFVIGPAISGTDDAPAPPPPSDRAPSDPAPSHDQHGH